MPRETGPEILVEPGMSLTIQGSIGGCDIAIAQNIPALSPERYISEKLDVMRRCFDFE